MNETKEDDIHQLLKYQKGDLINMNYPGIQNLSTSVLTQNSKYFAYATLLSVYVYDQITLKNINVITSQNAIRTISLASIQTELIAISYYSKEIHIVNILSQEIIRTIPNEEIIISICWRNQDLTLFCWSCYFSIFFLYSLDGTTTKTEIGDFSNMRIMAITQFNYDKYPIIFGGNGLGHIIRINGHEIDTKYYTNGGSVTSVELDPNCETNCLVIFKNGIGIFDIRNNIGLVHFIKGLSYSLKTGVWSTLYPGLFYTGDSRTGILRIWNSTSNEPNEIISISNIGFSSMKSIKENRIAIGFKDGTFCIYDIQFKRIIKQNISGHWFKSISIQFLPNSNDIFVTTGGEGSICIWNINSIERIDRIEPIEKFGKMTCMDISPGGGIVGCGYVSGIVGLFSLQTKVLIQNIKISEKQPILSINFNHFHSELLLICQKCYGIYIYNIETKEFVFRTETQYIYPIYGIFIPFEDNGIIYSCECGSLIYKDKNNSTTINLVPELDENSPNTINYICFSPTDSNLFVTGDIKGNLKLWNFKEKTFETIGNYKYSITCIKFHQYIKNIIIISNIKGEIIIYNYKLNIIITKFIAHNSSILSLAISPTNCFLLITLGFESSIKYWSLDKIFKEKMLKNILRLDSFYLKPLKGLEQLIKITKRIGKNKEKLIFTKFDIPHINDLIKLTKKSISKEILDQNHNETRIIKRAIKSKEKLQHLAEVELFLGNNKHYCEKMFSSGEYDLSVAISASVSYEFWREMMNNRSKLMTSNNEICNYQLAIGNIDEALQILIETNEEDKALIIALQRKYSNLNQNKITRTTKYKKQRAKPFLDEEFQKQDLYLEYKFGYQRSKYYLEKGNIYLSATSYLSIGDIYSAEHILMKHGEPIAAYLIDQMLTINNPTIKERFIMICIKFGYEKEIFTKLNETEKKRFVISIYFEDIHKREEFYQEINIEEPTKYLTFQVNNEKEKIHNLFLSGNLLEGIKLYLNIVQEKLKTDFCYIKELNKFIETVELKSVPEEIYLNVVCISYYFAMYENIWKGYNHIAKLFSEKLTSIITTHEIKWMKSYLEEIQQSIEKFCNSNTRKENTIYYPGYEYFNDNEKEKEFYYGKTYILEDGESKMKMEDAIIWFNSSPYSPVNHFYKHYIF